MSNGGYGGGYGNQPSFQPYGQQSQNYGQQPYGKQQYSSAYSPMMDASPAPAPIAMAMNNAGPSMLQPWMQPNQNQYQMPANQPSQFMLPQWAQGAAGGRPGMQAGVLKNGSISYTSVLPSMNKTAVFNPYGDPQQPPAPGTPPTAPGTPPPAPGTPPPGQPASKPASPWAGKSWVDVQKSMPYGQPITVTPELGRLLGMDKVGTQLDYFTQAPIVPSNPGRASRDALVQGRAQQYQQTNPLPQSYDHQNNPLQSPLTPSYDANGRLIIPSRY
jgi:hypothetical protein